MRPGAGPQSSLDGVLMRRGHVDTGSPRVGARWKGRVSLQRSQAPGTVPASAREPADEWQMRDSLALQPLPPPGIKDQGEGLLTVCVSFR